MAARNSEAAEAERLELVITRVFDAPRSLVFKVWTEPEHLLRWYGPRGFTISSFTLDPRPGGAWRCCMRSPQGQDFWVRGKYLEVVAPERLSFTWAHEDEHGGLGHETVVTVALAALGGKTELTLTHKTFESATARDEHHNGWSSSLECLDEYLAGLK
jgi:uncharacterized protein YndB with AHSA1/START domain